MGGGPPPPPPPPPVMGGGPPPPPPPPPVMGGGPPPPPPPPPMGGPGGPPPPPPPPPMGGPPPPPPPPGSLPPAPAAPAPAPAAPGDSSAFLAELRDPNRRKKLRKVAHTPAARPSSTPTAATTEANEEKEKEARKLQEESERQELFIELLGYMEAPNGNIEELCDKAKTQTNLVRSFAFTLMRKGWVVGYRVTDNLPEVAEKGKKATPRVPVKVWLGREVMTCIELADLTEAELMAKLGKTTPNDSDDPAADAKVIVKRKGEVGRIYMYRLDEKSKQHVVDEIALVATKTFPKRTKPFDDPEPPQDASLENRNRWEKWNEKKLAYFQSDWPQFELIYNKLVSVFFLASFSFEVVIDEGVGCRFSDFSVISRGQMATSLIVQSTHHQLQQTLSEMRAMGEAMHTTFSGFTVPQLRRVVESIPGRIKDIAKKLQKQTGIIIRDESLKLTPEFLKLMNMNTNAAGKKTSPDLKAVVHNADVPVAVPLPPAVAVAAAAETQVAHAAEASTPPESITTPVSPTTVTASPAPVPRINSSPAVVTPTSPTTPPPTPLTEPTLGAGGSMITLGGVPFDVLLPLLKKSFNAKELKEEKLARRLTM
ncbi:uncharacterized protein EV422DRAFT_545772 [Fimicolochytrium jonesii]|uniref:uncharacterized protein n=1 Tax=Fimicolochytrium jonesii TaxID=1396493 RepID=UPI0022FE324A|nr:uncharacterized protein EV422DRAFT_545772 [Fimicolochytrium jonesii]KAI8816372.1 hypothetical protein EV422DRAFT_545772 [Fimicolochytrium jonesii]